jgi:NAD(P)-dependent dehydrogenase (short-subunit alcohol dehydrogenase family)
MGQFEGKTALVTGSSQGRALAEMLGKRGAAVTLNYPRDPDKANAEAFLFVSS